MNVNFFMSFMQIANPFLHVSEYVREFFPLLDEHEKKGYEVTCNTLCRTKLLDVRKQMRKLL